MRERHAYADAHAFALRGAASSAAREDLAQSVRDTEKKRLVSPADSA